MRRINESTASSAAPRRRVRGLAGAILLVAAFAAYADDAGGQHYGPIVDKVVYEVRTDQTQAVKDIVKGKADFMMQAVPSTILDGLSAADRSKLDIYTVPSGSWSILLNPIPNKAPYTWTEPKTGKTSFNPLAIREVRFALNWLFSRKRMVDDILKGNGEPVYTPMTQGQPGTYRYNLIPARYGVSPEGDEAKALADIEAAMTAASDRKSVV